MGIGCLELTWKCKRLPGGKLSCYSQNKECVYLEGFFNNI